MMIMGEEFKVDCLSQNREPLAGNNLSALVLIF
jgi:hypothetical protein